MMSFLFTGHNGEAFEVAPEDLLFAASPGPHISFDGVSAAGSMDEVGQSAAAMTPSPLIRVCDVYEITVEHEAAAPAKNAGSGRMRSVSDQSGNGSGFEAPKVLLAYNDYGELVDVEKLKRPVNSADLTVTETLRLILKAYHNKFRLKMGYVVALQLTGGPPVGEDCRLAYSGILFLWEFTPKAPAELPPDVMSNVCIYRGPPKVLEIGCGDGSWCFKVKEAHPDWIIEGLDDTDYWSKANPGKKFRDFMESDDVVEETEYFSKVHTAQDNVEFTVRSISALLSHSNPIPCHMYSFIRAREIFSKLESYKGFLEDVRRILQPEGVVEFIEFDPRPRVSLTRRRRSVDEGHISRPQTDWTDKITDRFTDPYDEQLAAMVPEWTQRVNERHKATLRPRDGVPAANLKSWLEGAGFWDVKELVMRLPVGGDSPAGKLLLDFMKYQTDLENCIPLLATKLPQPNFDEINFGNFFINMHVVSGRKPRDPRPGDMLRHGIRQGMTTTPFEILKRADTLNNNQWARAVLDARLVTMMKSQMKSNLNILQSYGEQLSRSSRREQSERVSE